MKNKNDLEIKKELDTVYIDSSGKRHLDYMEARCAESQIAKCKEHKLKLKQKIMEIQELIMQVLKSKIWGFIIKSSQYSHLKQKMALHSTK